MGFRGAGWVFFGGRWGVSKWVWNAMASLLIHSIKITPTHHKPKQNYQVTLDGLHFGGNYTAAQEMVKEAKVNYVGFDGVRSVHS